MTEFPLLYCDPRWTEVFRLASDDELDLACCTWFEQWALIPQEKSYWGDMVIQTMPSWNALSNRVAAPLSKFFANFEGKGPCDWRVLPSYWNARKRFSAALACIGWEGAAMRVHGDSRAYAGLLLWTHEQGYHEQLGDILLAPEHSSAFSIAIDEHSQRLLSIPWVVATCLRLSSASKWFAQDLVSPQYFRAMQKYCSNIQGDKLYNEKLTDSTLYLPREFIEEWFHKEDVWIHMLLQEGFGHSSCLGSQTIGLWLHWAQFLNPPLFYECEKNYGFRNDEILATVLNLSSAQKGLIEMLGWESFCKKRISCSTNESVDLPLEL